MASTEAPTRAGSDVAVERLAVLDEPAVAMLQGLVADSHWNQTPDDWSVFHQAGSVHVVRDGDRIVASGAVLPMGPSSAGATGVSWISMILVTPAERGRGLGRAVFGQCLREVQASGRIPMLDATPAGEALYRQFGFETLWRLTRWRREPRQPAASPLPAGRPDLDMFADADAQPLGFERRHLLAQFLDRPGTRCIRTGVAIALVREGRVARQIGPVLAAREPAAVAALARAADSVGEALFIDVPDDRPLMRAQLQAAGFEPQRGFARMARIATGQVLPAGQLGLLHAIAGPEFA
jgi:GNAT superfamily N-acetyltransferase